VAERHAETGKKLAEILRKENIRIHLDDRNEKIGYKIREWSMQKVPNIVVLGDKESELEELTVRIRGGEQQRVTLTEFLDRLNKDNKGGIYF